MKLCYSISETLQKLSRKEKSRDDNILKVVRIKLNQILILAGIKSRKFSTKSSQLLIPATISDSKGGFPLDEFVCANRIFSSLRIPILIFTFEEQPH